MKRFSFLKNLVIAIATALALGGCSLYELVNGNRSSLTTDVSFDTSYDDTSDGVIPKKIMDINASNGDIDMPSLGDVNILVIPVKVRDYANYATEENREKINRCFFGNSGDTSWESVASFYQKSSYKKLRITGKVSSWYDCSYTTREIAAFEDKTNKYFEPSVRILEEAVSWYKKTYSTDCREFDSDKDGIIDGVWLVYSAPDYSKMRSPSEKIENVFWAYTYSNYGLESTTLNSPEPYRYCWASFDFMFGYGSLGIDAHTYIHETGHLLGLDDYYVASKNEETPQNYSPMGGVDMMDNNIIDHDSFSKMALGWVEPKIASNNGEYTLKPYEEDGDCLIIPTDRGWNGSPFDEYILVEFYTPTGLNKKDSQSYYPGSTIKLQGFSEYGIRIFHVDARMVAYTSNNEPSYVDKVSQNTSTATAIAHSNSSAYNHLNPEFRLIQLMDAKEKKNFDMDNDPTNKYSYKKAYATNSSLFKKGDSFSYASYADSFPVYRYSGHKKSTMNNGYNFSKTITITNISSGSATISIS